MPLLDHFHPPLHPWRHWEGLHSRWTSALADSLNDMLPSDYFAEPQVTVGRVEVDVGAFQETIASEDSGGGTAVAAMARVRAPQFVMPAEFPDLHEVQIFGTETGARMVACIELVSLGNKDRPEARRVFAAKCAAYLHQGIGLIVVDIVTSRHANLHNELVDLLQKQAAFRMADEPLYAAAYRPVARMETPVIEVWTDAYAVGSSLSVLPLAIDKELVLPVDLDATYSEACRRLRLTQ